jgi:hypothetical protein
MSVITNSENQVTQFRILALRHALNLEIMGMKKRGKSAYSILKAEGFKGTKQEIFDQLSELRTQWLGESV